MLDNQPDSGAGQLTGFWCWIINQIPVLDNQADSSSRKEPGDPLLDSQPDSGAG